jgi:hypothetical protein
MEVRHIAGGGIEERTVDELRTERGGHEDL